MTSRPSSVNSCARIEPVQPSPMITTSFFGSFVAMPSPCLRRPLGAAFEADRRQREALVVAVDPVPIVVAGAGESDQLPLVHVAVAAVNRIGKKAQLDVFDGLRDEHHAVGAI